MTSNRLPLSPVLDQILNGGTGVAINLPALRKKVADDERMFLTEGLNNAFIFKFPRFGETKEDAAAADLDQLRSKKAARPIETGLYVPYDVKDPARGGYAIYLRQANYSHMLREFLGIDVDDAANFANDVDILNMIDDLPSLDPFLLKESFGLAGLKVSPKYFEINPQEEREIRELIQDKILPIVGTALGVRSRLDLINKSKGFLEAIWDPSLPEASLFVSAFGISTGDAASVFGAWKGITYYQYAFQRNREKLALVFSWMGSELSVPVDLQQNRAYAEQQRMYKHSVVTRMKDMVRELGSIFREYETCYSEFLDRANPKPFREFLLNASKIYWLLGYCTTAIIHICTAFRAVVLVRQSRRLSFDQTNVLLSRLDLAVNRHRNRDSTLS
jgi:hypothetical protein